MTEKIFKYVKDELKKYSENEYKKFSASLIPNIDNVLGVRLPNLRKIAKNILKDDWQKFLFEYKEEYMEETLLKAFVITYLKEDFDFMMNLVKDFVPKINNWAVCDSFCTGLKFMEKNRPETLKILKEYLKSKDEFTLRFVFVTLLAHFIDDKCIDEVLKIYFSPDYYCYKEAQKCDSKGSLTKYYYTKMAIAWGISICYVKFPEKTLKYLKNNKLDDFVHNKSISKIIESYRVSKEDKDKLRFLRRKKAR